MDVKQIGHLVEEKSQFVRTLLSELAATPEVVALGEMGLDFYRDYSPRSDQERALQAQLELACDARSWSDRGE